MRVLWCFPPCSSTTSIPPLGLVIVVLGHCFNKQYLLNVPLFYLFSLCTQKHKFIHCPSHNVMSAYEYVTIRIDSQIKCAFLNTHSTCIEIADWQTVQQWGGGRVSLGACPEASSFTPNYTLPKGNRTHRTYRSIYAYESNTWHRHRKWYGIVIYGCLYVHTYIHTYICIVYIQGGQCCQMQI